MTPDFMYQFTPFPTYVGKWIICEQLHINTVKKPCWLHKKMAKFLLGWEWQDLKKDKTK